MRYVDDFLLFADDKATLWRWRDEVKGRLARLRLTMHEGAHPRPTAEGVPFLGFVQVNVFFSRKSLPELGVSDYRKQIDEALDRATHMVVVTSSVDNVQSPWLEAEWGVFVNEKRSGRKPGNLVTVMVGAVKHSDLPPLVARGPWLVLSTASGGGA